MVYSVCNISRYSVQLLILMLYMV